MGWDDSSSSQLDFFQGSFSVSIKFRNAEDSFEWWLTGVYGPCLALAKVQILDELRHIQSFVGDNWVIGRDFNFTRFSYERSNGTYYTP